MADAGAEDSGSISAKASGAPEAFDPKNRARPSDDSEELQSRAKGLFEAIVSDVPTLADPFWFPKEPFIPLKDVKGPERYWEVLHSTYAMDVHALHRKRKPWKDPSFVSFELGSTPKWVAPGEEANKVGYWRSYRGKLRFSEDGQRSYFDVHTVISWQGRWYITHLRRAVRK